MFSTGNSKILSIPAFNVVSSDKSIEIKDSTSGLRLYPLLLSQLSNASSSTFLSSVAASVASVNFFLSLTSLSDIDVGKVCMAWC
ncbi:MAG: hypothetical protein LN590_00470 [Rickettsia endosymbiont of Glossina mortisans submortisans]|nr:hypothetical protein [Rickettsia endosymbiont of Glossina mortisans submortisans]